MSHAFLGESGKLAVSRLLSKSTNLSETVRQFEDENSLPFFSCKVGLPLLDVSKVPRGEVYQLLFEQLRAKLLSEIEAAGGNETILVKLLKQSLPFIHIPELRPIPIALLNSVSKVPKKVLSKLGKMEGVEESLPVQVKRQLWERDNKLFRQNVVPFLRSFLNDRASLAASSEMWPAMAIPPERCRQRSRSLQRMVALLGGSHKLYLAVLRMAVAAFTRSHTAAAAATAEGGEAPEWWLPSQHTTPNTSAVASAGSGGGGAELDHSPPRASRLCALRVDLALAMHDAKQHQALSGDPAASLCLQANSLVQLAPGISPSTTLSSTSAAAARAKLALWEPALQQLKAAVSARGGLPSLGPRRPAAAAAAAAAAASSAAAASDGAVLDVVGGEGDGEEEGGEDRVSDAVYGAVGMVLGEPRTIHALCRTVWEALHLTVLAQQLPSHIPALCSALLLLQYWERARLQSCPLPLHACALPSTHRMLTHVLPLWALRDVTERRARFARRLHAATTAMAKLSRPAAAAAAAAAATTTAAGTDEPKETSAAAAAAPSPGAVPPLSPAMYRYVRSSILCRRLLMFHAVQLLKRGDLPALRALLPPIVQLCHQARRPAATSGQNAITAATVAAPVASAPAAAAAVVPSGDVAVWWCVEAEEEEMVLRSLVSAAVASKAPPFVHLLLDELLSPLLQSRCAALNQACAAFLPSPACSGSGAAAAAAGPDWPTVPRHSALRTATVAFLSLHSHIARLLSEAHRQGLLAADALRTATASALRTLTLQQQQSQPPPTADDDEELDFPDTDNEEATEDGVTAATAADGAAAAEATANGDTAMPSVATAATVWSGQWLWDCAQFAVPRTRYQLLFCRFPAAVCDWGLPSAIPRAALSARAATATSTASGQGSTSVPRSTGSRALTPASGGRGTPGALGGTPGGGSGLSPAVVGSGTPAGASSSTTKRPRLL